MQQSQSRIKNTVRKQIVASNTRIAIGYVITLICGLIAIAGGSSSGLKTAMDIGMTGFFLVLLGLGILQIVRGTRRKRLIALFKEYAARLSNDPGRSMEKLAAAMGVSIEKAKKNLLKMIRVGFFVNAYVDSSRNILEFARESVPDQGSAVPTQQAESASEYACVSCPGCGAKNKIEKGSVGKCEFCNSYLSAS